MVQQHAPLVVAEIELPPLAVGQILVRVAWTGICGKQLEELSGRRGPDPYLPHLLGHEAAGVVVETGPGVQKVSAGDQVVLHWMKGPGIEAPTPAFRWNGGALNAGRVTTFSEWTIVSENRLTPIPAGADLEAASLLGCAVTTGLGIVFRNLQLTPGQSIVVFGVGGVGMNVIQGAAMIGAHPIVAVDLHDRKLAQAAAFGATHGLVASRPDLREALLALSGPQRFDAAVEVTGLAAIRELTYEMTGDHGTTVLAGVPHVTDRMTLDTLPLAFGRRLVVSHGGETHPDVDIPRYLKLFQLGKLKLREQITHRFPLAAINEAMDVVRRGEAGRCLIRFGDG